MPQNAQGAPETVRTEKILVVEDEESLALGIRDALQHSGF